MAKIHSDAIKKTDALLQELKNNQAKLIEKGFNEYFIKKLESDNETAKSYNDEYEQLKAGYKAKTAQLNTQVTEVKKQYSEAKRFIKSHFYPSEWVQFGIVDKQ
jgi:chemotaxis regulatin CheY-phosphate phosphatase CheZ